MKTEILRDETIKATGSESENVTIDIKCEKGNVDEHKQRKSIVCLTLNEEEGGMECIVAGSFSPMKLMAYIEALDGLKKQLIKKFAGVVSNDLDEIIKNIDEEDK